MSHVVIVCACAVLCSCSNDISECPLVEGFFSATYAPVETDYPELGDVVDVDLTARGVSGPILRRTEIVTEVPRKGCGSKWLSSRKMLWGTYAGGSTQRTC